jgi:hypothetical protein
MFCVSAVVSCGMTIGSTVAGINIIVMKITKAFALLFLIGLNFSANATN